MTLETQPTYGSTSAAGSMLMRQARGPVLVGWMLAELGTSSAYALPPDTLVRAHRGVEQTTAGAPVLAAEIGRGAIAELRRVSGLTWEQLANLFNVSRRSLHFWASGKPMTAGNEEHLQRLLAVLRKIDRGSASANRAVLLSVCEGGQLPIDLLTRGEYDEFVSLVGTGETRRSTPQRTSERARAVRAPRPPEELVGALQDRIHPTSGRLMSAKSVRGARRK